VVPEANPQPVIPSSNDGLEKGLGVEVAHVTVSLTSVTTADTAGINERESKRTETRDCNPGMAKTSGSSNWQGKPKLRIITKVERKKECMTRTLCSCGENAS
jgi:hypothetical protein